MSGASEFGRNGDGVDVVARFIEQAGGLVAAA